MKLILCHELFLRILKSFIVDIWTNICLCFIISLLIFITEKILMKRILKSKTLKKLIIIFWWIVYIFRLAFKIVFFFLYNHQVITFLLLMNTFVEKHRRSGFPLNKFRRSLLLCVLDQIVVIRCINVHVLSFLTFPYKVKLVKLFFHALNHLLKIHSSPTHANYKWLTLHLPYCFHWCHAQIDSSNLFSCLLRNSY